MRDQATEKWLEGLGAAWTYVAALNAAGATKYEVDVRSYQTRAVAVIDELVDRYADDMANGDVFPAVLARHVDTGRVALLGGVHRWRAAGHADRPVSAYLIECDDTTAVRISVEDNRRHGEPLDAHERLTQAARLVDDEGWSIDRAARCAGVGVAKLRAHLAVTQFELRVKRLGVSTRPLGTTARARLAEVHDDDTFIAAVHLASDAQLTTGDVAELVTDLARAETKAAMSAVMTQNQARHAPRIRRLNNVTAKDPEPVRRDARHALVRLLYEVSRVDPADIARSTTGAQRPELRKQLKTAAARLIDIDQVLR